MARAPGTALPTMISHRCPRCRTHIGLQRLFVPRPGAAWACGSCGAPLCWVEPDRRAKLLLCAMFAVLVVGALLALSASGLGGAGRLFAAAVLALVLGIACQVSLARVGLAPRE